MTVDPATNGGVRMWVAPEPKYPARLGQIGAPIVSMGVYFAILFALVAAGAPTIAACLVACPIGVAAAWGTCHYLYRRWQRQWDAWFAAEAERRAAERLARFDAHVARLGITEKGAP